MPRLALIVSVAALACLAGPAASWGCITSGGSAHLAGSGPEAPVKPDDPMAFSISNLDAGAHWTVSVGGRVVGSGTTTAPGNVEGAFALADYGATARTLAVTVHVEHAAAGSGHDGAADFNPPAPSLQYAPPRAAQAPAEQPSGSTSKPTPTGSSGPGHATPPAGIPPTGPTPPVIGQPRNSSRGTAPTAHLTQPARPQSTTTRQQQRAAVLARTGAPRSSAQQPTLVVAARAGSPGTRMPVAHRHARAPAQVRVSMLGRADDKVFTPLIVARADHPASTRPDLGWLIAALALLALVTTGGLGWAAARASRRRDPPEAGTSLELEAELQEIIAEHRAGELSQHETAGVAGPPG